MSTKPKYRVLLACKVPPAAGSDGAKAITEEFENRKWHQYVACTWDGERLLLRTENDFDSDGRATIDEFSDAISACVEGLFDIDIEVVSVSKVN